MAEIIVLDSGPLGRLTHPARNPEIVTWLEHLLRLGATVATENVGQLAQFVPGFKWQEITAD